jgi:tetratricopeptide (TPR) repeat protein
VVAVAAFGVPPLRRERKPADALAAALQVGQSLGSLGVDASVGIATGRVFCGLIGGADRREYALVGSTVNLAARLMGLGGGGVCCDAVTEQESRAAADFAAPQRLTLKGIPDPVEVFRLRTVREHPGGQPEPAAIAGRDQEIADLIALTRTVADGGRRIVVLEGTPGLGKTTLVQAVAEAARHAGARVLMGTARWNGQAISYHAWVPIVERVLGITDVHDTVLRAARARAVLDSDPELERRGTLLNDVVPLGLAVTAWSEGLDGTSRAEETRRLVTDLLLRFQGDRPLLLVLDDVQWCDPASWSVILRSLHGVPRLVLLLAARPIEDPTEEVQRFLADPRTDRRTLRTLGAEAISRSAAAAIGAATLPAGLASWLDGHAGGNPFFAREMALALVRAGSVAVEDGVVIRAPGPDLLATLALPASVEALVLRRIDALDPVQQVFLKTASVLGPTFTRLELGELHPAGSDSDRIDDDLRALTAAQLLATRDDGFAFTHQIVLDAAYGTMVAPQLRGTHAQVARYLERTHAGDLPSVYGRLAYHWSVAREDEPTFRFLSLAATDELRKGALREAALHLSQALALDEERGYPIALDQRARWYRQLGDAHEGLGEMPEAQHNMLRALAQFGIRLPSSGPGWKALVARELTRQLLHLALPPRAYSPGSAAWERARDTCLACMTISEVKYQENNAMGMAAMIFAAANAADCLGDSPGVARALGLAGVSFAMGRNWPLARRYFARAEAVAVRIEDASGHARCKMTEGSAYWWVGDFKKADAALTISREIAESHGLRREFESAVGVDSNLTLNWGHFAVHRERGMRLLASSRERSRALGLIWSLLMVGKAHLLAGEFDAAEACFAEIRAQPNLLAQERVQTEGWWLALHLRRGEWTQVRRLADVVADGLGVQRGGGSPSGAIVIPMHWQPFWCHSEARVALLERASPAERPHLLRDATRAWKAHLSFGRRFDIGRVGALVHAGRTLCLGGNVVRGRRMLLRGEALAAAWEMPYDLATAHQFLALAESPGSDARRRRFDNAREGFAALPCPWELHQVELLMARETA